MRGLSRNKVCIGVAMDVHGASPCLDEGPGKTSRRRTWDAFGSHMERGSELVHDREKSHAPRQGQPPQHGQPGMQPAQEVPEVPQRIQGVRHSGMARPPIGLPQRRQHHRREWGLSARPRHALPKSAQIQELLCEGDPVAGHACSTAMQIGLGSVPECQHVGEHRPSGDSRNRPVFDGDCHLELAVNMLNDMQCAGNVLLPLLP